MSTNAFDQELASVQAAVAHLRQVGGEEFVCEMVELLREQTGRQLTEVDAALARGEIDVPQRHAHSMKSSFGNFGATRCQAIAAAIDAAGKNGDVSEMSRLYIELRRAFTELSEGLAAITVRTCPAAPLRTGEVQDPA
jgi:HPt (histidine-containing phosphotransfer) domain-containing protein